MPNQNEYNVSKQTYRKIYTKINLLNFDFKIVDELSGVVIGTPSFTNETSSDIRRTCNVALTPTDSSFDIKYGNKIWIDKYIQTFIGIQDIISNEVVYTNMGIYIINNPSQTYDATNNTITLSGVDLMAKMTGMRSGYLEGMDYIIPVGSNVRNVMIDTIKNAGFNNYVIDECSTTVPNEIRISSGGTVYDILSQLINIDTNYQIYFDVDGVFHYNLIPTTENNASVVVNDDLWNKVLINYNINTPFEDLKNTIEIYGATHISNYVSDVTYIDDSGYGKINLIDETLGNLSFNTPKDPNDDYVLPDNTLVGFVTPSVLKNNGRCETIDIRKSIQYVNQAYGDLWNGDREDYSKNLQSWYDSEWADVKQTVFLEPNTYYVVRWCLIEVPYTYDGVQYQYIKYGYWEFLGHLTAQAKIQDNDVNSPYSVEKIGELRIVLQDGDYVNLYTDRQCEECCKYELYQREKIYDSVSITCVPIYWLDTNTLIEITLPNKQGNEETNKYLIKSISTNIGTNETQTINLMRVY